MKTLLKKTLTMLLVVCTVVSLYPAVLAVDGNAAPAEPLETLMSATSGSCGTSVSWVISDQGVLTISGTGDMAAYKTAEAQPWFLSGKAITAVVIEEGVTSIGSYAFSGCSKLSAVTLPASMKFIGDYAFSDCSALKSISLPASITHLGSGAFRGCSALASVNIPDAVTDLPVDYDGLYSGAYYCSVFDDCTSLASVEIGASLQNLYYGTFADSASLTKVTVSNPNTVLDDYSVGYHQTTSGYAANSGVTITCYENSFAKTYAENNGFAVSSLGVFEKSGNIGENLKWHLKDGVLTLSGTGTMMDYASNNPAPWYIYRGIIHTVVVSEGVTSIGAYAFDSFSALTSVQLPKSLTVIGDAAFLRCSKLKRIDIPSVVTVSDWAFLECTKLQQVFLPSGVKTIGEYAFGVVALVYDPATKKYVSSGELAEVTLPDSIESISGDAFNGNTEAVIHYCTENSVAHQYAVSKGMTAKQHYWGDGVVEKAATETETGIMAYVCVTCGAKKTTDIPKLDKEDTNKPDDKENDKEEREQSTPMYRLYNPNSGEHFYTGSVEERENLVAVGWQYEGVAWNAPVKGGLPIYRLYNPNEGDHHYTGSAEERDNLVAVGWQYEGVAWNTPKTGIPLYRLYNPNAKCGSHHYTGSEEERDNLIAVGWQYEGVAWNGMYK